MCLSWGGRRDGLPYVHDSSKKRQYTTSIVVFNVLKSTLVKTPTTGTPHNGTMGYSCCNIGDNVYYFGGQCKLNDCYHNDLSVLNTKSNEWKQIVCDDDDHKPMNKCLCGMIPLHIDGEDYVVVIGGIGQTPVNTPTHSQYIPEHKNPSHCITNEIHMMCISKGI